MVRYGKIIITEYSLPTAMKSIKPFQPDKEVTQLTEKEEERLAALKRLYKKAELADKVAARGYHDANRAPACILQCACVCARACAHACVRLRACVRAYVSVRVPASQAKRAALGVLGRRGLPCSLFGYSYTGVKAKKYADKIVKRETAQGKDEHSLPSIAAAMVLKLRTAKKARFFTIRRVRFLLKTDSSPPWAIYMGSIR
jgi:hypothetical protein